MAHIIPVKYMYGGSVDAIYIHPDYPVLSSSNGSLINLLTKCLIDGFGEVNVSSISIDGSGTATASSVAHGYNKVPTVILVSGASNEAINGEWEMTSYTANTIVFDASDSGLTNTTINTGTIKIKVAPFGWSKPYSSGNIAVFRSTDPTSRRHFYRIDDNDTQISRIRGYELMSGYTDTGSFPYPLSTAFGRGLPAIAKNLYTNAGIYNTTAGANISWTLVGTSKQFYITTAYRGDVANYRNWAFIGDLNSYVANDYGASAIIGRKSESAPTGGDSLSTYVDYTYGYTSRNLTRRYTLVNERLGIVPMAGTETAFGFNYINYSKFTYPNPFSGKFLLCRPMWVISENFPTYCRGELPGIAISPHSIDSTTGWLNTILTVNNERFISMPYYITSNYSGIFFLTIDKDWNNFIL